MIPGVIIGVDGSGGGEGRGEPPKVGLSHLIKFLGFEEHLDWLKIDLNEAKIITVQKYKRIHNLCKWTSYPR